MPLVAPALAGLFTGLSLIVAIGAQNAFVLREGLARRHVGAVVAVCAVADALLIAAGVAGLGAFVVRAPAAVEVVRWLGVAFLAGYGVRSLLEARRPGALEAADGADGVDGADGAGGAHGGRQAAVVTALALTFLNPHVYLDTVLLLGSVAHHHADGRWWFAGGAMAASVLWFSVLGFGAGRCRRILGSPRAWQVLDVLIGLVMLAVAARLALSPLPGPG
ncbi:LysE/ArgO family amino acid transporter [Nocardioides sp. SYSU DS0651]|uniref:LysE/ArgO family amino acid transporter n=1 Tax=Nocardioides sp. SYSU DS0651 TaxID=3415955 RepID=UPI003F4C0483